jgi:predicted dithiol-disulfide oxidoreductase (DUF899 family)
VSGPNQLPNESREYRAARDDLPADPGQEPRITDLIWPLWNLLDLTPAGRGDDPDFPALSYPSSRGASA